MLWESQERWRGCEKPQRRACSQETVRKRKVKKWVRARNLSNAARKIRLLFSKEAESSKTNTVCGFSQTACAYKKLNLVSLFIQARMKYKRAGGIFCTAACDSKFSSHFIRNSHHWVTRASARVSLPSSFCALSSAHTRLVNLFWFAHLLMHKLLSHYTASPSTALGARNAFSGQFFSRRSLFCSDQK